MKKQILLYGGELGHSQILFVYILMNVIIQGASQFSYLIVRIDNAQLNCEIDFIEKYKKTPHKTGSFV